MRLIAAVICVLMLGACSTQPKPAAEVEPTTVEIPAGDAVMDCDDLLVELLRIQERALRINAESASALDEVADVTGDLADVQEQMDAQGC